MLVVDLRNGQSGINRNETLLLADFKLYASHAPGPEGSYRFALSGVAVILFFT